MKKVVLITGGSSGIGKAIGEFLHQKEFIVYGTSRNPDQIADSVFPLIALDVRNPESIQNAMQQVISLSGRIDILINNAGVGITGPLEEFLWTNWRYAGGFTTNARSKLGFNHQYYFDSRISWFAL